MNILSYMRLLICYFGLFVIWEKACQSDYTDVSFQKNAFTLRVDSLFNGLVDKPMFEIASANMEAHLVEPYVWADMSPLDLSLTQPSWLHTGSFIASTLNHHVSVQI